jgi:hypothetical protein
MMRLPDEVVVAAASVVAAVACAPVAFMVAACERAAFMAAADAPVTLVAAIAWPGGLDLRIRLPDVLGGPDTRVVRSQAARAIPVVQ